MNIAVIGANGRSGQIFVQTALDAGHNVRAGIRFNSPFGNHPNLSVMTCDSTVQQDVERLIRDQDAVVSLIGHVKGSDPDVQAKSTKVILEAMEAEQVSRLVSLTGTGVRQPGDKITLIDKVLNFAVSLADKNRVQDGIDHAELIKNSQVDWTIIRVLKLSNSKAKPFKLTNNGPAKNSTSRQEVARAILEVLEQGSFVGNMPIMSKA